MTNQKVLVVDDSDSMRNVMAFFLKGNGYDVTEAASGDEAIDLVRTFHYDVIITDINMPGMDGYEFIAQARKISANKRVPILTVTTEKTAAGVQKGKAAGATGWLVKPFDDAVLLDVIRRVAA